MDRAERQAEIDFLADGFKKSQIALCADYRGLTVAQITKLRKDLRAGKAVGRVVKNTLARISSKKVYADSNAAELEKFNELFTGPSLLVLSESDPVSPAKVLTKFAKDNKSLQVKGGWFEGKFVDAKGVDTLSQMPSKEELLGKLLALLNAPATQLLRLMKEPSAQVARVIAAQRDKLEKGA